MGMLEGSGDLVSRLIVEEKTEATASIWGLGFIGSGDTIK